MGVPGHDQLAARPQFVSPGMQDMEWSITILTPPRLPDESTASAVRLAVHRLSEDGQRRPSASKPYQCSPDAVVSKRLPGRLGVQRIDAGCMLFSARPYGGAEIDCGAFLPRVPRQQQQ
jgi:hypothetical protein